MTRRSGFEWLHLKLEEGETLQSALYWRIRRAILRGQLKAGTALPSTRGLAVDLAISRTTVVAVYEQLKLEGFIQGKHGSGMVVRELPLDAALLKHQSKVSSAPQLSRRGAEIAHTDSTSLLISTEPKPFRLGVPDPGEFPLLEWRRLISRQWQNKRWQLLSYSNVQGFQSLREQLALYLGQTRGVICDPEQIVIVSGSQQGVRLIAELLLDRGDRVWIENPGYLAVRSAFRALGAVMEPVPVNFDGIDIQWGQKNLRTPRMIYVTPSHQYPLGMTMSIQRRIELIEWATRANVTIIEDDYNSEFRYGARAVTALQGLAPGGRVLYVGTFTKLLFPGMRLGYVVLPKELVRPFVYARSVMGTHSISDTQAALAEFIGSGGLDRHVRRMRTLYGERKAALEAAVLQQFPNGWAIMPSSAGMHLVVAAPSKINDIALAKRAAKSGIEVTALSRFYHHLSESFCQEVKSGLILGFSGFAKERIVKAVSELSRLL